MVYWLKVLPPLFEVLICSERRAQGLLKLTKYHLMHCGIEKRAKFIASLDKPYCKDYKIELAVQSNLLPLLQSVLGIDINKT